MSTPRLSLHICRPDRRPPYETLNFSRRSTGGSSETHIGNRTLVPASLISRAWNCSPPSFLRMNPSAIHFYQQLLDRCLTSETHKSKSCLRDLECSQADLKHCVDLGQCRGTRVFAGTLRFENTLRRTNCGILVLLEAFLQRTRLNLEHPRQWSQIVQAFHSSGRCASQTSGRTHASSGLQLV